MRDKFRGIILGAAIGDAIGKSFEDLDIYQVEEFYRELPISTFVEPHPSSPAYFQLPNETSDETTIVRLLLESIVESKELNIYNYFDKLKSWAFDESIHKYPDPFILKAIYNLSNNITEGFNYSSVEGILRVVAVSMLHFYDEELSEEAAKLVSALTHRSQEALDAAVLFNTFLVKAIKNDETLDSLEGRIKLLDTLNSKVNSRYSKRTINVIMDALESGYSKEKAILNIGNGNYVLESFGLSLYYFLSEGIEYPFDAFVNAINSYWEFGGDTDAIGFMTGALIGAYHGYSFLPEELISNLKDEERYTYLADSIYDLVKNVYQK